jgi:hypothetical protein
MLTPEMLREFANTSPSPFSPHWVDEAKRLIRWSADTLEAAQAVIDERHAVETSAQSNEPK